MCTHLTHLIYPYDCMYIYIHTYTYSRTILHGHHLKMATQSVLFLPGLYLTQFCNQATQSGHFIHVTEVASFREVLLFSTLILNSQYTCKQFNSFIFDTANQHVSDTYRVISGSTSGCSDIYTACKPSIVSTSRFFL